MMSKGERNDFLKKLYGGEELVFTYDDKELFIQGFYEDNIYHMDLQEWKPRQMTLWKTSGKTMEECAETFLNEPLFEGKCFWDIESCISWIDG